ncbi:MAG TPA: CDP-diacylglycerol--serine O-phosphatidyltransferase, partial [Bdellovibrionota bacterium]|nr:CDP-diacylglycerol--serine O-phosphatidyltransferase [Bdellovibrionota bacterium]
MRKIYIVPNIVTTANMFCGFYSIVASMKSDFSAAAWAIVAASIFDMLDGRIARLAKATSEFGVQYDSLSDLISFGVAPAILLFQWALLPFDRLGWLAAFLFTACGALRLARFNVNS